MKEVSLLMEVKEFLVGIHYLSSKTGEMNIHVKYEVRVPPSFIRKSIGKDGRETFRIHGWTGYGKDKKTEDSELFI